MRRTSIKRIEGNVTGLKANQIHRLQHIYRRKVPAQQIVTQELARYLCELSLEINRQIGVLIDRKGTIEHVVVGDHKSIFLPDLGRSRVAANRLRGLRYVHTHLRGEPFTPDDMADLAHLRFEVMVAIDVGADGLPDDGRVASLLPDNPDGKQWDVQDGLPINQLEMNFLFFFQAEDGIRDVAVTGVQTCALPISIRILVEFFGVPDHFRKNSTNILIGTADTLVIRAQIRDDLLLIETLIEFRIIKRN